MYHHTLHNQVCTYSSKFESSEREPRNRGSYVRWYRVSQSDDRGGS